MNVNNSVFKDNAATQHGGVLFSNNSNITIVASEFDYNSAGYGGGALTLSGCNSTIEESEFDGNSAVFGGALASANSNVVIEATKFDTNTATHHGGVLYSYSSTVTLKALSEFGKNSASDGGGVLFSDRSNIVIEASEFHTNSASYGGVLLSDNSNIVMEASEFGYNSAILGGVLDSSSSKITIEASQFHNNSVIPHGGRLYLFLTDAGGVLYSYNSNITIEASEFNNNSADNNGGVLFSRSSSIIIQGSEFNDNIGYDGGVLYSRISKIVIEGSKFNNNTGYFGGVLHPRISNITIETSVFDKNRATRHGGVLYSSLNSNIAIDGGEFTNNNSSIGAVIYAIDSSTVKLNNNPSIISNNSVEEYAVIYLAQSTFTGDSCTVSHNLGSLVAFNSNITFIDSVVFASNKPPPASTDNFQEGGAVALLQSNVVFVGSCSLEHNHAENGGAVLSIESRLYVNGDVTVAHNTASKSGGGVYLLNSELYCQRKSTFTLLNNTAEDEGGGIHAISSTVWATSSFKDHSYYSGAILYFTINTAEKGGGLSLEANAKLYILKHDHKFYDYSSTALSHSTVNFTRNTADYGGAVYVDDNSNAGTCASDPKRECFFQVLAIYNIESEDLETKSIHFSGNIADIAGSTLYGGLLDRCGVSQFAEVNSKHRPEKDYEYMGNGLTYFKDISDSAISSISSRPVLMCLCGSDEVNCGKESQIKAKRGETFAVSLVAVDQIGHVVNGTIQASLHYTESGLAEGQLTREIPAECTDLTFNVVSPHNNEHLTLYASDGPCKDAELSVLMVEITFLPCSCPIGFQVSANIETNCTCECHRNISQYVEHCDSHTESFFRKPQSRAWVSYTNNSGYLVYDNCPFHYCNTSSPPVNLNQPNGSDAQCVFNRTSLLCGSCQLDLSLSLGSSQCLSCPSYWPAIFVTITIAAIAAGIALVALLLLLNMSVAVGTLNGLLFYANVVNANKSILLPFQEPNFLTIFISCLNLELGIDTCYFPGMDTYIKTWLELAFPAYVILLVALVIIISSYSDRFSNLIGKKDPVATLATLILLSYARLLEICFKSLSVGILWYPDGSPEMLWLPDATVRYLSGKHIPLFIVAVLILLVGLFYTGLLFSWQWILCLPRWRIFKWLCVSHPKLQTFVETYHTPYAPKHRYWTGMLLMARAVLYLAAAVNTSNDPTISLTTILSTVGMITLFKELIGNRVYRKLSINVLDTFFHWNVLFFTVFTWYSLDSLDSNREAAAYISVTITFVALLFIVFYHVYTYTTVFSKFKGTKAGRMVDRLLTESEAKRNTNQLVFPPDDDIHRFNELLDIVDRPVNTDDYNVPHRQDLVGQPNL